jgi:copper oxidase (laccase) domain-containing protein
VAAVHDVGLCTICADAGLFFSHRRDRGVTGRQAGIAWHN